MTLVTICNRELDDPVLGPIQWSKLFMEMEAHMRIEPHKRKYPNMYMALLSLARGKSRLRCKSSLQNIGLSLRWINCVVGSPKTTPHVLELVVHLTRLEWQRFLPSCVHPNSHFSRFSTSHCLCKAVTKMWYEIHISTSF